MPSVMKSAYGTLPNGDAVSLFRLTNASGITAEVTDHGAVLVSLSMPDRKGNYADITLGYDTPEGWLTNGEYFGATVGRFGNRIALDGDFALFGARGAAYVFVRSGSTWTLQQRLLPDGVGSSSGFGWAVAIDGTTAVVSAVSADGGLGAVYVYAFDGATWMQRARLQPSAASAPAHFGFTVAIDEGVILVGADERQVKFAQGLLAGMTQTDACRQAGYSSTEEQMRATASKVARGAKVQALLRLAKAELGTDYEPQGTSEELLRILWKPA